MTFWDTLEIVLGWLSLSLVPVTTAVMIYQGISFFRMRRLYKKRLSELENSATEFEYIINFSGHPMDRAEGNWFDDHIIINVSVGNVDDLVNLESHAKQVIESMDEHILNEIKQGKSIVYAFPGMSTLTQYLLPLIHSLSGRFPLITIANHTKDGFEWLKPKDLHTIRTNYRLKR